MKSITINIDFNDENIENDLDRIVQIVKDSAEKIASEIENGSTGKRCMTIEGEESVDLYFQCYE